MANKSRNVRRGKIKGKRSSVKVQSRIPGENKTFFEKPLFLFIIILVFTFIAFLPSLKNEFITSWDDNVYITNNVMITQLNFTSVKEMFTTPINCTYVPLPLLSFAIEYHLFGLDPLPYHISNLVLHLVCTLLVFYFLRLLKLDSIYATFGALLFGIHPMHVESVAWITERKDLLYSLFYLGSMIFYLLYIQKDNHKWRLLYLSIIFFILSLLSKIQAVALPIALLLIDYYLERPLKFRLAFEKIPFFLLSLLFGIAGILILNKQGVLQVNETYTFFQRIFFGLYALSVYILKFFAPFNLSAFYLFPVSPDQPLPLFYYLNPLFLLLVGVLVYQSARYTRAVVFGSLFFLFNIMFLLQIVSAGIAFLADRFTYIPYIGLIFIVAWTIEQLVKKKKGIKYILFPVLSIFIILFISLTFNRCKIWENGLTLWTDVIEKYPMGNTIPYLNRGNAYLNSGQYEKAIADYSAVSEINPKNETGYLNTGFIYYQQKNFDKAIEVSLKGLKANPGNVMLYDNLAYYYFEKGDYENAVSNFRKCLEIDGNKFDAKLGLAVSYYCEGDINNSKRYFNEAKEMDSRLSNGMSGIAEMERETKNSFSDKMKMILKKMFEELK
jgi:tetratricopeptide (TPR) repeat protein